MAVMSRDGQPLKNDIINPFDFSRHQILTEKSLLPIFEDD